METAIRGIVCFEVSGTSNIYLETGEVISVIKRMIDPIRKELVAYSSTGAVNVLVFPDCERAYRSIRNLIQEFIGLRIELMNPLFFKLSIGLHAAILPNLAPSTLDTHIDVSKSWALMTVAHGDSIMISYEAYCILKHLITSDRLRVMKLAARSKGGKTMEFYQIAIEEFFRPNQYLIRIEPPTDLILLLAMNPELLYKISPRKFEEIVAELLTDLGYVTDLTKQTRDKGIDIIAIRKDTGLRLEERYLVQCKRNAPQNKVTFGIVHALLGAGVEEPNTGLILATTSTFTKPAFDLAEKETIKWKLHLKDYNDIQEWLFKYAQKRHT
jgi:hypothetical protein